MLHAEHNREFAEILVSCHQDAILFPRNFRNTGVTWITSQFHYSHNVVTLNA